MSADQALEMVDSKRPGLRPRPFRRHQATFWDAMILTSARRLGCACVWSEDLNAGQSYDGVVVRNPFES